jgi:peptidoglycan/LPS O-acetylase OafA/YrhL
VLIAYGSYMTYLVHRLVFLYASRFAEQFGEVWVTVAVLASIPLVLAGGVWLQRMYDARSWDATRRTSRITWGQPPSV